MKIIFTILCCILAFGLNAEQYPHLILHFDVNKTLIASDKTENKSIEDVINELLSKKYSACWSETNSESMTFEMYVNHVLLPGVEHNAALKMERLIYLIHFIDYLKEHNHPLYTTVVQEFNLVLETLKQAQGNVFSSFYHLIQELNRLGISYTLFLRSFGKEVFEVKNEINMLCNHLFKNEGTFRQGTLYINDNHLSGPEAIYQFFLTKEHTAIRDDWQYWMEGEMNVKYGKPVYIDPEDRNILILFFDDNIKINSSEKNIVSPLHSKTGEPLNILSLIQNKQVIPVNTLEAILNENYYIERLQEALQTYQCSNILAIFNK